MNASLITALAGVLGSVSGASAAIATTWISQKGQTIRERAKSQTRKRETLYGEFITEASQQLANAFDHSLDKPETLVKLYVILGRIRLVSSDPVLTAAEERCDRIVTSYAEPNRKIEELSTTIPVRSRMFSSTSATLAALSCVSTPYTESRHFSGTVANSERTFSQTDSGTQNKIRGRVKFSWTGEILPLALAGSAGAAAAVEVEAEQNLESSSSRTS